jgi:ABC-type antimicrobial peptide transport system permease subunit
MVLGEAALLALAATALGGLLVLLALRPLVASQLHGAGVLDPAAAGAQALVLLLAAVAGSFYPARRAAGMHPAEPLKQE